MQSYATWPLKVTWSVSRSLSSPPANSPQRGTSLLPFPLPSLSCCCGGVLTMSGPAAAAEGRGWVVVEVTEKSGNASANGNVMSELRLVQERRSPGGSEHGWWLWSCWRCGLTMDSWTNMQLFLFNIFAIQFVIQFKICFKHVHEH